jgi:hypothetical protein
MNSGERLTINRDRAFTITADMIDSARFNYDNYCQTLYGQPINTITTSVWSIDEDEKVKLEKDNICLREKVKELEKEIKLLKSGAK